MPIDKIPLDRIALRKWREDRGFSQKLLAELMRCGLNTVIAWEQDGRVHPRWFPQMHIVTEEHIPYLSRDRSNERDHDPADVLASSDPVLPGTRLAEWRVFVGLSPEELARKLGGSCTAAMVRQWENDGRVPTTMREYMQIVNSDFRHDYVRRNPPFFLQRQGVALSTAPEEFIPHRGESGARLREQRELLGLTQAALTAYIRTTTATISRYEREGTENMGYINALRDLIKRKAERLTKP